MNFDYEISRVDCSLNKNKILSKIHHYTHRIASQHLKIRPSLFVYQFLPNICNYHYLFDCEGITWQFDGQS